MKVKLVMLALPVILCITAPAQVYVAVPNARIVQLRTRAPELRPISLTISNNSNWDIEMLTFDHKNINERNVQFLQNQTLYAHTTEHFVVDRTAYPAHLFIGFAVSARETAHKAKIVGQWEYVEYENSADTCHNYGAQSEQTSGISYVPNVIYENPSAYPYYVHNTNVQKAATVASYTAVPIRKISLPFSVNCIGNNSIDNPQVNIKLGDNLLPTNIYQ